MLPPVRTGTTVPGRDPGSAPRTAATPAAPEGSTICLPRSATSSSARDISSSETVRTSTPSRASTSKGTSPGVPMAMPSAMVVPSVPGTGRPAAREAG